MVGIERNKDPELTPKERNTSYFVILDDRKHGRAGKFAVFYDVDTGDYLEPPEGFLESEYQTLKEWYNIYPEKKEVVNDNALKELSLDNQENQHYSDLTEGDIPKDGDGDTKVAPVTNSALVVPVIGQVYTGMDVDDDAPPF